MNDAAPHRLPAASVGRLRESPRSHRRHAVSEGDVFNVWEQQLAGGASKQLTRFTSGRIFTFQWSRDGRLAMTRGSVSRDVVLIELK